jgi:protein AaeX
VRFTEINLFGVYVAPISVMMVAAWVVARSGCGGSPPGSACYAMWHPAVFVFSVYMIVLSSIVLVVAAR